MADPRTFPAITSVVGLFLGATIGSFLNVVIYRMPRGLSLSDPKNSFCPNCKARLTALDLVPLLSWLILRGKCRHCGAPVASRYFWVESFTGLIWAGLWYQYLCSSWDPTRGAFYAAAASALVAIIFIDWQYYIIPDQINAWLLFVGIGWNIALYARHDPAAMIGGWPSALVGALTGVAVLWGIAFLGRVLFRKDAMGHGDIKMARGVGAVLFPVTAVTSFALAVALGAVLGIVQILARSKSTSEETENDDEEVYEPESIGSLLKSGLGYILCLDVIGLFVPKLYLSWFGEDPFEPVIDENGEDDVSITHTMIPFGPYLALGAIVATVFQESLLRLVSQYWSWAAGGPAFWEHLHHLARL